MQRDFSAQQNKFFQCRTRMECNGSKFTMKTIKKILAVFLAMMMSVTVMAACSKDPKKNFSNMTVLNIGVYDGGLGIEWISRVADLFEARYEGVPLEEGKTGVHVEVIPQKDRYLSQTLLAGIQSGTETNELYYTSQPDLSVWTEAGVAYDLTSVVTEKVYKEDGTLAEEGEEAVYSIYDKMDGYYQNAFNTADTSTDAEAREFYGIPFDDNLTGFIYDHDLFEEQGWLDYSGRDGTPGTVEEFYLLLQRIARAGFIPFTLSNDVSYYSTSYVNAIVAQYDGLENFDLLTDYEGTYVAADGTETIITEKTGWKLASLLEGKCKAAEFVRNIMNPAFYDPDLSKNGHTYSLAQRNFIMSKLPGEKRIAMIFEGEWWENEARGYFESMGNMPGQEGYGERDFRFMSIPAFEGQREEGQTSLGSFSNGSVLFANKRVVEGNPVKEKLVREWLQFQHSEQALEIFTMVTSAVLPYDYDLSEEQLSQMTPFARDCWDVHRSGEITIVRDSPNARSKFARSTQMGIAWRSRVPGYNDFTTELFSIMYNNPNLTAQAYFKGIATYYNEQDWMAAYNLFYNL